IGRGVSLDPPDHDPRVNIVAVENDVAEAADQQAAYETGHKSAKVCAVCHSVAELQTRLQKPHQQIPAEKIRHGPVNFKPDFPVPEPANPVKEFDFDA